MRDCEARPCQVLKAHQIWQLFSSGDAGSDRAEEQIFFNIFT